MSDDPGEGGMTVEETLRAMLDGWTEDGWIKGTSMDDQGRMCLSGRAFRCSSTGRLTAAIELLDETGGANWPERSKDIGAAVVQFNDHPDTTFADVVALVEKAAALAAARGL